MAGTTDRPSHIILLRNGKLHFGTAEATEFHFARLMNLGKIEADLNKRTITYANRNKTKIARYRYERNDLFIKEIKYFISHIKKNKPIGKSLNLFNGIKTLKFALELKS